MVVRRLLHARGWRYRLHSKQLPGTPDLVFPGRKKVLFVHGCFWHGHECRLATLPQTRREFWSNKIAKNRERDNRKAKELEALGWKVMTVWQCDLKQPDSLLARVEEFLENRQGWNNQSSVSGEA